jgi:O-6-methylguanine DNA methyltransferase
MLRNFNTPFGKYVIEVFDGCIKRAYFGMLDGFTGKLGKGDELMLEMHRYCLSFPLRPVGTSFQLKVWESLCDVTWGQIVTYKDIASGVGRASAVRAVASAIAKNPIAYLIPCHRVIGSNGETGGYRWNNSRKKMLLTYESIQSTFHSR